MRQVGTQSIRVRRLRRRSRRPTSGEATVWNPPTRGSSFSPRAASSGHICSAFVREPSATGGSSRSRSRFSRGCSSPWPRCSRPAFAPWPLWRATARQAV